MDSLRQQSVDVRFGGGASECRLKEVKIAALIGLFDVATEHPAVAALISRWRRLKRGASEGKLGLGNLETYAPCGHVDGNQIACPD
jgi:hypothetical protein